MRISLVVVGHHSSAVLPTAVASFRRECAAGGHQGQLVVVEHSEAAAEAEAAAALDPDRLEVCPNRGYAAGLNTGAAAATGEVLLLANPDLELLPGALAALLNALEAGFTVVGPRIVADHDATITYPVAEDPAPGPELARLLRQRWQRCWTRGLSRQLAASHATWTATGPRAAPMLRGPLLALRRSTWELLGPLDEGYFLYCEETEWLWRARRRGSRLGWVPTAAVVHPGGHSTRRLADRAAREARSRDRFLRRNWPAAARWLAGRLAALPPRAGLQDAVEVEGPAAAVAPASDLWLMAPWRHLVPAAGCTGRDRLPPAAAELAASGRWYAVSARRLTAGDWRVTGRWTWQR